MATGSAGSAAAPERDERREPHEVPVPPEVDRLLRMEEQIEALTRALSVANSFLTHSEKSSTLTNSSGSRALGQMGALRLASLEEGPGLEDINLDMNDVPDFAEGRRRGLWPENRGLPSCQGCQALWREAPICLGCGAFLCGQCEPDHEPCHLDGGDDSSRAGIDRRGRYDGGTEEESFDSESSFSDSHDGYYARHGVHSATIGTQTESEIRLTMRLKFVASPECDSTGAIIKKNFKFNAIIFFNCPYNSCCKFFRYLVKKILGFKWINFL